ncbi:hypothetical protein [Vagococcus humatus]|nr:hypothetical protein [Vagococcus humatus]
MKKTPYLVLFFIPLLFLLISCGITEELEMAKLTNTELTEQLTAQKKHYQTLEKLLQDLPEAIQQDQLTLKEEKDETDSLYDNKEGEVYANYEKRQALLADMAQIQKEMSKQQKQLQKLVKKQGVDVDNKQLALIAQSLDIIFSDLNSINTYAESSFKQEADYFSQPLSEQTEEEATLIQRTYGSIHLLNEEAQPNIDYTLSLIKHFEKEARKTPTTH